MHENGYVFFKSVNGVWLTKEVLPQYFKRDSFDYNQIQIIKKHILEVIRASAEPVDDIEETVIPQYGWEYVQQALFAILSDDSCSKEVCSTVAQIIWGAVLDSRKIKKKTTIALLYHRLGNVNAPYEDELIWSITANLYNLDVVESDYNPLKDDRIINKLKFYGIS